MFGVLLLLMLAVGAVAEERPVSNLQTLRWQVEAQARERTLSRRTETQLEKPPEPPPPKAASASRAPKIKP
jgi:hypothetical protein